MRALRVLLTAALAGVTLTGCTPAREPILGLSVVDGRSFAVLYPCAPDASLSLYPGEGESADPALQWSVSTSSAAGPIEVELLAAAPPGWEGGPSLAVPRPGVRYHLAGSSGVEARIVRFTTADLERIGAGQVLVPGREGTSLLGRAEFEEQARDACP